MPIAKTDQCAVLFMHIPKTGGSTIEEYLSQRFDEVTFLDQRWTTRWRREGLWRDQKTTNSPQHMTWDDIHRATSVPNRSFAIVRDPMSRLFSEYGYQSNRGVKRANLTKLGFPIWLRIMLQATRRNPYHLDNHFRPQSDFIGPDTKTFPLEEGLHRIGPWLDEICGAAVGVDEIAPQQTFGTKYQGHISAQDVAYVAAFYAADYALLPYSPPRDLPTRSALRQAAIDVTAWFLASPVRWLWKRGKF